MQEATFLILTALAGGSRHGYGIITDVEQRSRLRASWAWECRHRRVMVPVRVLSGIWLVALTAILYGYGLGGWWGLLLVPSAALHFYVAYRSLRHGIET